MFSRSPSAFQALCGLGISNLPCEKTLKGYMNQHLSSPGINEKSIQESSKKYTEHVTDRVENGDMPPLKEGILIWDETKACVTFLCIVITFFTF